ncbi:MAG: heavy metal transporter [Winogradskyella sp.]|nr:heavy metal transporter [Winogradskyella sp.]NNF84983.1 heavy metal transporter [Winogradskyella sp.]
MKHTYNISGMTCDGCKNKVEKTLQSITDVENVSVDLDNSEATITTEKHIDLSVYQNALPDQYQITTKEKSPKNVFKSATTEEDSGSTLKQLFPLLLILIYLFVSAFLLNRNPWQFEGFMLDFMGLFYIVFSFFKFLDLKGFPQSFSMYDPLAKQLPIYGKVYPFLELILGLMFLMRFEITIALIATILILGITTVGVAKALLNKRSIQCACLGTVLKLPMTKATLIENSIMLVMALVMVSKVFAV